uniref:Core shell protein Gag P30 domain-containing protein n=1 Tax=Buteo japonicus TaxID=224669 RepID=A0A8C0B881_9AVES
MILLGGRRSPKPKMIHYCMEVWGGQPLTNPYIVWPIFGSSEDWVCQQLNAWVNGKKPPVSSEESEYAALWIPQLGEGAYLYPLKEKKKKSGTEDPSWPPPYVPQPPEAPLEAQSVLRDEPCEGPKTRSRSRRELKSAYNQKGGTFRECGRALEGEGAPMLVGGPGSDSETEEERSQEAENDVVSRGLSRQKSARGGGLFPLREMLIPGAGGQGAPGTGYVAVPLNTGDVREFKKEMGNLLDDPIGVAERLDQFLGPNLYTWEELQSILGILFTAEERNMIRGAGMRVWDQQHQAGPAADQKWPLARPNWNNQDPVHRDNMSDLRMIIIQGIRESVPRGQNINKTFNEQQKKDETPTEWLERLRKSFQLYSGVDPATPVGQALLKTQFVAKSWVDIR